MPAGDLLVTLQIANADGAGRHRPRSAREVRRDPDQRPAPEDHEGARLIGRCVVTCHPSPSDDAAVYVISIAAELAGMHAQTLRQYDRLGLVTPTRTPGGGRRYSARDISLLREVQRLSQDEGVNLAGIKRVIELEAEVQLLNEQIDSVVAELDRARAVIASHYGGSRALVLWQPQPARR